jgi:hypothetical protein
MTAKEKAIDKGIVGTVATVAAPFSLATVFLVYSTHAHSWITLPLLVGLSSLGLMAKTYRKE